MIYCPSCGTANRDGSRFCNECGHKLPSKTGIMCPMCSHVNPMGNVYCDKCHARLIPASPSSPAEPPPSIASTVAPQKVDPASLKKGLSLPTIPADTPPPSPEPQPESSEAPPATPPAMPPSASPVTPSREPEDETAGWMQRLRSAMPKPSETPPAGQEPAADAAAPTPAEDIPAWMKPAESEVPDWFERLSSPTASPAAPPPAETPEPAEDAVPDWMHDLGLVSSARPESSTVTPGPAEGETPDVPAQAPAIPPVPSESTPPIPPVEEDLPDWMRDLGITPPAAPTPSAGPPSDGAPSVGVSSDGAPTPVESQPSASEMDWLDQLREQSDIPEQPELDTTPEWLSALGLPTPGEAQAAQPSAASPEPEASLDELPDWLKQMDAGAESKPHGIEPQPPTPAETSEPSEEPDWLSGLRESAQAETPPESSDWLSQIEPSSESASGEPDWLTALRGQTPESSADQPEWLTELGASTPAPSTELPGEMDWSSGMEQPAEAAPAEEPAAPPEAPDWLKDIAAASLPTESPVAPETEVPEWLRDITSATPAPPEPSEAPVTSAFIGEDELVDQVETPDWLSGIDQPVAPRETEPAQPVEIPTWLRDLGPLPAGAGPAAESPFGELAPAAPGEVPEWLQQRQAGQPQPAFADEAGHPMAGLSDQAPGATGLEAATIPSWLEALRPHEAALQAEVAGEGVAETEGVLMGLSNVLPASALMGQMHSAPAVTKAEPSPTDLARASLFQEMLGRGSLTPVVVTRARRTLGMGDRIARWLIAALLIVLVLIPNFRSEASRLFQLSFVDAREFKPAADQIETLNAGDRVLMVFDYDASQAGEMNAIAEAFVRHIGLRGAEVIVDSLNPVGTALAQQVRAKIAGGESPAPPFVNQGYVPGQAVGVQRILASTPVNVIVVLAGSPDSLRWWLEQVAASRLTTPVIAGLSAAALPQALPYRQSGQISATVSGLMAGLAYQRSLDPEEDANQDGLDRIARSEALYLSQLTFAAILLVGAIVSLIYRPRPSA